MYDVSQLMAGISVQHLQFVARARDPLVFDGACPGSSLRGALYKVLAEDFCTHQHAAADSDACPVCWLLAAEHAGGLRGHTPPRPLTVEPPPADAIYRRGETFAFGMSLVGRARDMIPYLARAAQRMGDEGVGRGRGRFALVSMSEYCPLLDTRRLIMERDQIRRPTLAVTASRVEDAARALDRRMTLRFKTPTSIRVQHDLVGPTHLSAMIGRLIERCELLALYYGESALPDGVWREPYQYAVNQAQCAVRVVHDGTRWQRARSYSATRGSYTDVSGFVGEVRIEGALDVVGHWLLWGQSLHVGNNAVKGNGWYEVVA